MRTLSAIGEANVANILKEQLTEKQDVIKMMSITIPTISNSTFGGNSIKLTKNSPTTILNKVSAPIKSALLCGGVTAFDVQKKE